MSPPATRKVVAMFAAAVLVVGAAVTYEYERRSPPAPVAAPGAAVQPIFGDWLKFEPAAARDRAEFQEGYVDQILGHQVFQLPPQNLPPERARQLLLDDDELLLSTGRRLWSEELHYVPGLDGKFCYLHSSFCVRRLFEVQFFIDGAPAVVYQDQFTILRYPSHTLVQYALGPVRIDENKYITDDDRAACTYRVRAADGKPHHVDIEVTAPYLTMPNANPTPAYPLLGSGSYQGLPIFAYLDAPDFTRVDAATIHLRTSLRVLPGAPPQQRQVAVSFEDRARSDPAPHLPEDLLEQQVRAYNRWFFDNVPYFDCSEPGFKKMWYYRWWVARFNLTQANTPDLSGYRFYEGKLGFDNAVSFAVPMQLKELTYLRAPDFGLQQAENAYHNLSAIGAVIDPPGSPYWNEMYSHWIGAALAEFNRVHPIPPARLAALLPAMASDVRAWLSSFDPDGDALPQRAQPRVTGYDLDILSYWFFDGMKLDLHALPADLERVDFASFVYANAAAIVELAGVVHDAALVREFQTVAQRIRDATLAGLWDDDTSFFYPRRAADHARAPIRELHGFFPFTMLLAPDDPRYTAALAKLVDPNEFWSRFPPVIASLYYYRHWGWDMNGLTRNIAPNPISMGARTLLQALKHYHQRVITPAHFMHLMQRYNALVYPGVNPFDPFWRPNVHEYYSEWEPYSASPHPKPSKISHDFHSMYCSLIVEGAVGLTPRLDDKIELQPAALNWQYFLLDRLRYHDSDLTIVWDAPGQPQRYPSYPQGFSLYIDGQLAFTRAQLGHIIYDPRTHIVTAPDEPPPATS